MNDDEVVRAQLGRPPRSAVDVVRRCHLGLPVVLRMPARLPSGEPFPTRFWLSCPLLVRRLSRLEAEGRVGELEERSERDADFAAALEAAHQRARDEREHLHRELGDVEARRVGRGGVGGARGGVKCLHLHYADHLGRGANPVGAIVADEVEPTDCDSPCVIDGVRSPTWREPAPLRR